MPAVLDVGDHLIDRLHVRRVGQRVDLVRVTLRGGRSDELTHQVVDLVEIVRAQVHLLQEHLGAAVVGPFLAHPIG